MKLTMKDVQMLCSVLNRHHKEMPLLSRSIEKLSDAGLLTCVAPMTIPEGKNNIAYYPSALELTDSGKEAYRGWLDSVYKGRHHPDISKLTGGICEGSREAPQSLV